MKFKSLFILFNLVILFSFLFVFAVPFFALGSDFAVSFWASNWPLALVLLLILGAIDAFFLANYTLFTLLEREDWPALVQYLEEKVLKKGKYSPRLVKLLANTYLVLSDAASVQILEQKLTYKKPVLLDKNALIFAAGRILSADHKGAYTFLTERAESSKLERPYWVRWYRAFSLLLLHDFVSAEEILLGLCRDADDPLVCGLSAFFLKDAVIKALPEDAENIDAAVDDACKRIKKKFPDRRSWNKYAERERSEIHVVILSKSLDDTAEMLYNRE